VFPDKSTNRSHVAKPLFGHLSNSVLAPKLGSVQPDKKIYNANTNDNVNPGFLQRKAAVKHLYCADCAEQLANNSRSEEVPKTVGTVLDRLVMLYAHRQCSNESTSLYSNVFSLTAELSI